MLYFFLLLLDKKFDSGEGWGKLKLEHFGGGGAPSLPYNPTGINQALE